MAETGKLVDDNSILPATTPSIRFKGANLGTPPATVGLEPGQVLSPIYRGGGALRHVDPVPPCSQKGIVMLTNAPHPHPHIVCVDETIQVIK